MTARKPTPAADLKLALGWLKQHGSRAAREGMSRYNIPSDRAFGVPMNQVQRLAKQIGRSHELARALWDSGWYEARLLAAYISDPALVTPAQMDRWRGDFDNWAVCDTVCFVLFDRTPYAWRKVEQWARRRDEFGKRAAFALLWGLTVHDKTAGDERFMKGLRLIERAASDNRHLVAKAVSMALRATGKRNSALNAAALSTAQRLAASPDAPARTVGKEAVRELTSPSVVRRLARRQPARA